MNAMYYINLYLLYNVNNHKVAETNNKINKKVFT